MLAPSNIPGLWHLGFGDFACRGVCVILSPAAGGIGGHKESHMPVHVNLRHLETKNVELVGEISPQELELDDVDEMIHTRHPLKYVLEIEKNGPSLLVSGNINMTLNCECVRCLKPFQYNISLDPYDLMVPLEGEDKAKIDNDLVDLTPYLREDTLLAFPQHPLCEAECDRLPPIKESKPAGNSAQGQKSAWDELNKLKLK
ncbi:MAG TPA: YceD family protein [Verrucomicrobiae bacterium]